MADEVKNGQGDVDGVVSEDAQVQNVSDAVSEQDASVTEGKVSPLKMLLPSLSVVAISVLGLLSVGSMFYVRPRFSEFIKHREEMRLALPGRCIARGRMLARAGQTKLAFQYLQRAMIIAENDEARADAGQALAEFFLEKARDKPRPYAIMAKQYLDAVVDIEKRPQQLLDAYLGIIKASSYLNDAEGVLNASESALEIAVDDSMKVALLLARIDVMLEIGSWFDVHGLMIQGEQFESDSKWKHELILRKALAGEKVLSTPRWFAEFKKYKKESAEPDGGSVPADEELRSELFKQTVDQFNALVSSNSGMMENEALFREARLYFNVGNYEKAEERLYKFLTSEPSVHQGEGLLMMAKLARLKGKTKDAEDLISAFIEKFAWNNVAVDEFFAVVEQATEKGQAEQALTMIERYKVLPSARERLPDLLEKAGELAMKLGQYERADKHYAELLGIGAKDDYVMRALVKRADIAVLKNDYKEARNWLIRFANKYPFESGQSGVFFRLLDIAVKEGDPSSDLVKYATTATMESPDDPRTPGALMIIAQEMEKIGLPALAQVQYNKLALFQWVNTGQEGAQTSCDDVDLTSKAILGNARCLYKTGDLARADSILRGLCSRLAAGRLRSEAAYYWAMIALDYQQQRESLRRFELVNEEDLAPEMAARTAFEKVMLEISLGKRSVDAVDAMLVQLADLPAGDHLVFVRRAYSVCFEKLAADRQLDGMKRMFASMLASPYVAELPLWSFNLKLGSVALAEKGLDGFIDYMQESNESMKKVGFDVEADTRILVDLATNIKSHKDMVNKYM